MRTAEKNTKHYSAFSEMHPLVNFIYLLAVIVVTMISLNVVMIAITFLSSFLYSTMLCGTKIVKRNILIFIPILFFTVLIQPLFSHNGVTPLFYINEMAVTLESVFYGIAVSVLLGSIVQWFSCYNKIISSDKFLYLFGKFSPAAMLVISMIFRMIPLLKNRYAQVHEAQMAMGRKKSVRLIVRELSVLIAWSLESSIETSDSMESRGYGLKGRTSFCRFRFLKRDALLLIIILALAGSCVFEIVSGNVNMQYFPEIRLQRMTYYKAVTYLLFAVLAVIPIIIDRKGRENGNV